MNQVKDHARRRKLGIPLRSALRQGPMAKAKAGAKPRGRQEYGK